MTPPRTLLLQPDPPPGLGPDQTVRWFARRQFDVVGRAQLLSAGLSRHEIDGRLARGVLRSVHRGVFALGAADLRREGRFLAALLAGPPLAVISHRSAATLWGMLPDKPGPVELTVAGRTRSRPQITTHRSHSVVASSTTRSRIPCTTIPRTLIDLGGNESFATVRRAWTTLAGLRTLQPQAIERELRRYPGRRGTALVRVLLEGHRQTVTGRTRSQLEAAALAMCADSGLPMPRANAIVRVGPTVYEADLLWAEARVIVELDGWAAHGHVAAFRQDRRRDFDLQLASWTTVRLIWDDITVGAADTAQRLGRLLAQGRSDAAAA